MTEGTQRKLAAIMSADVVGYSRLMGADETGTLAAMRAHRSELWNPVIEQYGGRVVGTAGDSILVEFASAVAAVESSIAVQRGMIERNAELPEERRMLLRIGVNIGEVVMDGDDIFGDGVNVAARLQAIADSGGIAISGNVYEQVSGKLDVAFSDDGEHDVKNIDRPVHIWRWSPDNQAPAADMDKDAPPLSDKPSIAVLPFDNMSGDPEQEYFSDGITEDIITELSRYPDFLVIARNSSFVYKGKSVDLMQVANDLGVRFMLEGSVRKAGSRIRVTAQLIEANTSGHIWAERFDRELVDIFAVQDEITAQIVSAMGRSIQAFELLQSRRKAPTSLDAYDKCLQASAKISSPDRTRYTEARSQAQEAIELDPNYAQAHAIVAQTQLVSFTSRWPEDPEGTLQAANKSAQSAVELDDHNFFAYNVLGLCQVWQHSHDLAIASLQHALELNPNEARTRANLANALVFAGQPEEALEQLEIAMRLDPHHPPVYPHHRGRAYFVLRQYDKAELAFSQAVTQAPGWPWARLMLAAALTALGKVEAASAEVEAALKISPDMKLDQVPMIWPFREQGELDHLIGY
ncbi:MAG: tetratricopeptide repeat protein [Rhodospirillaceae bacterium]|nr:tetratricopeptide repeat protein [Rhodospirillaceae bacterium]